TIPDCSNSGLSSRSTGTLLSHGCPRVACDAAPKAWTWTVPGPENDNRFARAMEQISVVQTLDKNDWRFYLRHFETLDEFIAWCLQFPWIPVDLTKDWFLGMTSLRDGPKAS